MNSNPHQEATRVKTIFLLLPVGITIRNFLHTGVLDRLVARPDVRLVVFTPVTDALGECTKPNERLVVERMPAHRPPLSRKALHAVLRRRFYRTHETASTRILQRGPLSQQRGSTLKGFLLGQPFSRSRRIYRWLRTIDERFLSGSRAVDAYFTKFAPALVIATHPTAIDEYDFLKIARSRGVTTIGMIKTWDNLTMKGYMAAPANRYLVWNETMKRELETIHGIAADSIIVTGIAQFDPYADADAVRPRDEFFRDLGLDPSKRTILYATSPEEVTADDPEILHRLASSVGHQLPADIQIVARLHQMDSPARYRGVAFPHVALQVPGGRYESNPQRRLMDSRFITDLRDALVHSGVVINTCSTMTLDAVAVDRPVVNIAFDVTPRDYYRSCRRYYDLDHYQPIIRSGAAKIAASFEEFVTLVQRYLDNPSLETRERAELRDAMCFKIDGKAGCRIAEAVFGILDATTAGEAPMRARAHAATAF